MVDGVQSASAQISQVSRLRAAAGDGTLTAETLEAIQNGAIPPTVSESTELNNAASEVAETPQTPLRDAVQQARTEPFDIVELSPEAVSAVENAPEAVPLETTVEEAEEQGLETSQTVTQQNNQDTATVALGNAVDIET